MSDAQPSSGTMTLQFLQPSTQNKDRNDYRISGTVRWDSQAAIRCFSTGVIGWAYEHNLTYQKHIDRKIWSVDLSSFPAASHPYIDTTASDFGDRTDLTFGLVRPETLKAGVTYKYAYSTFLPRNPPNEYQSFYLAGQVLERDCPQLTPWCNNFPGDPSDGKEFIGVARKFKITGTTCFAWRNGKPPPTPCPTASTPAPAGPSTPAPGGGSPAAGSGSVSLAQGPPAPAGYRYAISLSGFAPNSAVSITCFDSVDSGGFYTFSLTTDAAGAASTSSYCYSGDGPDHWVVAGGRESNHVSWGAGIAPPPPPAQTWSEQETPNHPVNTFTNYHNASGMGPAIAAGQWVQVSCKVYDPTIGSVNPDGYWYRIASAPWNNAYYSPANTFMNGDPYGGPYTHNTDFAVPNC
ncbi:MAG: hypothetical protein ABW065_02880 [Solirubrobacterales bacterium]